MDKSRRSRISFWLAIAAVVCLTIAGPGLFRGGLVPLPYSLALIAAFFVLVGVAVKISPANGWRASTPPDEPEKSETASDQQHGP